jgi:hypothetical protein
VLFHSAWFSGKKKRIETRPILKETTTLLHLILAQNNAGTWYMPIIGGENLDTSQGKDVMKSCYWGEFVITIT